MGGADANHKGQAHLAPHHRTKGDVPFRTRLFRTWQATSAGAAGDVLVGLLPGGKAGLPVVSPSTPPTSPTTEDRGPTPTSRHGTPGSQGAVDPVSPQRPSTSLVPSGDNFLQRRCLKTLSEAVAYTEKFKNLCRRRFGSLIRAWRELLDPQGVGCVGFVKFCEAARLMGFERVSILWKVLDSDGSKFITLDIWDPPSYRALMEFRHICFREYGGLLETFRYALDLDGSGTCRKSVLAKFLRSFEYMGDVDTLWNALDNGRGGFITVEELGFLLHWTGERFSISAMDRDFAFRGERLKRAQEERRLERRKRQHEMARQQQEWREFLDEILKAAPKQRLPWPELQQRALQKLTRSEGGAARGKRRKVALEVLAHLPAAYVNPRDPFVRLPQTPQTPTPRGDSLRVICCGDLHALRHEIQAAARQKEAPLVVVDFSSELCLPCARLKPEIHELSLEMPEVVFLEVDVEMNSEAADAYGVTSLPTFIFFKQKKLLGRYEGSDVDQLTLKLLEYK